MATGADWDARRYHRVAQPHAAWGASVLDRLQLRGHETVLDAGCGSGKVTQQLLERLPNGKLMAADLSPAMLAEARVTLAAFANQVTFLETDLLDLPSALGSQRVDAIFSTATFHWIDDHPRLFTALRKVLKPGGRLVSQFGGGDNLAELMRATDAVAAEPHYRQHIEGKKLWRYFAAPEETRQRLEAAGFTHAEAWLEASPQTFPTRQAFIDFASTVVLRNHLNVLPQEQHEEFASKVAQEVQQRLGGFVLDYVRLNADATA